MDDLPVWGFVGPPPEETKDEEHIYIYTHKSFDINYNDNRVRRMSVYTVIFQAHISFQAMPALLAIGQLRDCEVVSFATKAGY